jgi:glycosyltransferase involved in cell wall biosynthesis
LVKPRHCMIVHAYYPVGETRVQREAAALTEEDFDVTVVCLRDEGEAAREEVEGIRVRRLPVRRNRGSSMLSQAFEYLRFLILAGIWVAIAHLRRPFAVVQVHTPPDALVFAAIVPKLFGAKVILDIHDLLPEFFAARTGRSLDDPLLAVVAAEERLSCRFADRVVTVTSHWRDELEHRAVRSEKLAVVMNLADGDLFGDVVAREPEPGRFVVLYHGTFTERYGVDLLIDAAARLRSQIPGLEVHLVGDGEQREVLRSRVRDEGLEEVVMISDGMVGPDRLPGVLAEADVGVVPNRSNVFTDGLLPTKLLEYVLVGIPAVVADTPGVRHYFDDAMVSYFPAGDGSALAERLYELFADPDLRSSRARRADVFNSEHSWDDEAKAYVALVRELSDEASGREVSGAVGGGDR